MMFIIAALLLTGVSSFPTTGGPFWTFFPGFWTTTGCNGGTCPTGFTGDDGVYPYPFFNWTSGFFPGYNWTGEYFPEYNFTGINYPGVMNATGSGYPWFFYCPGGKCSFPWVYNCTGPKCFFTCKSGVCTFPNVFGCTGTGCGGFTGFTGFFTCNTATCSFTGYNCTGDFCWFPWAKFNMTTGFHYYTAPVPMWYYSYFTPFCSYTGPMPEWYFKYFTAFCNFTGPMASYYYNYYNYFNDVHYFPYQNNSFPNWYYRGEFQFLDFQMNQTMPFTSNLMFPVEIYTNVTFGYHPFGMTNTFSYKAPATSEGYGQLFAGTYNGIEHNMINIDRTWSVDTCGYNWTSGYMSVYVKPLSGTNPGVFQEGAFTCFFNFTFPATYTTKTNSVWSTVFECSSGDVFNYSYKLWYQFRFYNIDSTECGGGKFITL